MFVVAAVTVAFIAGCIAWGLASPIIFAPTCVPSGFVDVSSEVPGLIIDLRYYTPHNFMGRRVAGYNAPMCLLTSDAARALAAVASDAASEG
jgi:D-alanyl-D-alanine dipeptidase